MAVIRTAGFRVKIEENWKGEQVKKDLWEAIQKALPVAGEIGADQMRANIRPHRRTGEVEASIMWRTHKDSSAVLPPADPGEVILAPKSMRSVFVGSAFGAGRFTKSGKRVSIVTSVEYGTRKSAATPFIVQVPSQIRGKVNEVMGEAVADAVEKPR